MKRQRLLLPAIFLFLGTVATTIPLSGSYAFSQDKDTKKKEIAGKADVLKHVAKRFATLRAVDVQRRQVVLQLDGEDGPRTWSVNPDAELKVYGWWGRLEQFTTGDRVWVWFSVNRKKEPKSILMLADEISEQDIHGLPHELLSFDTDKRIATVKSKLSGTRQLKAAEKLRVSDYVGQRIYVQSAGDKLRLVATEEQLVSLRARQREYLRELWRKTGLPGTVTFLHPLGGEMELMLDHEAIRWGRYLKTGDEVTIHVAEAKPMLPDRATPFERVAPIKAQVKHVKPWRERTSVRLVTNSGLDQADLQIGLRVQLRVPEPPKEVQVSGSPTDIGRLKSKQQRIDWFLASIYCSCKIAGDRCTGMFYTLASCNVNACGMPNRMRGKVAELIDQGKTDEQIWQALQKLRGPMVVKQHLLR